jgi:hypothetical protein
MGITQSAILPTFNHKQALAFNFIIEYNEVNSVKLDASEKASGEV